MSGDIISDFPVKVRKIVLSGGEPSLYYDYTKLTNELLKRGYFVTVFSNLATKKGLQVIKHSNIRICATHHQECSRDTWDENLKLYRLKYRVDVDLFPDDDIKTSNSHVKAINTMGMTGSQICFYEKAFGFSPEGKLYPRKFELLKDSYEH